LDCCNYFVPFHVTYFLQFTSLALGSKRSISTKLKEYIYQLLCTLFKYSKSVLIAFSFHLLTLKFIFHANKQKIIHSVYIQEFTANLICD